MAPAPGIAMCQSVVVIVNHEQKEPPTMTITTLGLDLAKNISSKILRRNDETAGQHSNF